MSDAVSLFVHPVVPISNRALIDRIAAYTAPRDTEEVLASGDRWVLASNLQKAIRRGLTSTAAGTAGQLLDLAPRYLWRRLIVIAYEDVGYGDVPLWHDVLKTFRREALHRELGPERVVQCFAHELALARKSRSLCDALAMLEFSIRNEDYERRCIAFTDEQLVETACDPAAPLMEAVAALRHVCGYREFARGRHQVISPARRELMQEICERQQLTDIERALFQSGQNVAESLNIPIPMVSRMVRAGAQPDQESEQVFEGKSGILSAALDRHTRAGKRCFARLAKEVGALREFFDDRPALDPAAAVGAAVFILEGAVLNRRLVFVGAESLRGQFNRNFLEYAGVAEGDQPRFLELVGRSLPVLNDLRANEIDSWAA